MTTAWLGAVSPVLCVTEMAPAMDFFVRALGFTQTGSAGEGPSWASFQRDAVEFMLLCSPGPTPQAVQDWAAYVRISDADALHGELVQRGASVTGPPEDKPYRCREFEVRMPDGRLIAFGQNI